MNEAEAIKILGLETDADKETIEAAFEEKLFNYKKEILPLIPVPSLIKKRLSQLEIWVEVEALQEPVVNSHNREIIDNATDVISFLEYYEKEVSLVKLSIMNSTTFQELKQWLEIAIRIQLEYMNGFKKFFSHYTEALPEETKSREIIDTGKLLTSLKSENLTSEITWEIEKELARIGKLAQIQ